MVRTGATFANAAAEYLRYVEHDRGRKRSTVRGYRSMINTHLLPAFGPMPIEDVTTEVIESWIAGYEGSPRSRNKLLIQMHGILGRAKKVYGLHANAAVEVEKFQQKASGDTQVFSPEEVWALVRAAASEQDAALFLTAAFTGLRMGELLADAPRQVIDRAVDRFGGVDVLVVNHAMSGLGRLNEVSTEQLDMAWVVNARAAVLLVQAFAAQHDDSRQDGRVLLFTSGQHLGPMADELPSRSARARCIK